jgi:hypothetical protein
MRSYKQPVSLEIRALRSGSVEPLDLVTVCVQLLKLSGAW